MTALLTTEGLSHIASLDLGETPTQDFDGLVFGRGNDDPALDDTVAQVTQLNGYTLSVAAGYPKLGDTDARNSGAGAAIWTWRFEREAGSAFVASNVAVTNYRGGSLVSADPLLVHAKQTVAQRLDERLIVWVNASATTDANVVTATETALENRVQRVASFTARTRQLQASPQGSVINDTTARARPQPGQNVTTMAWLYGPNGTATLAPADVERMTLEVERYDAESRQWQLTDSKVLDCHGHVYSTLQRSDIRWLADGGYNVLHVWSPPKGASADERTWRLTYRMTLCDRDVREWATIVEVDG